MKKRFLTLSISFLLILSLAMVSCNSDDDGPNIAYHVAEITSADLPQYFEVGETYNIDVDYVLPSACDTFAGLDVEEGLAQNNDSIYYFNVRALSSYNPDLAECDQENDSLEATSSIRNLTIPNAHRGQIKSYTFRFLTGYDSSEQPEFLEYTVPLGAPADSTSTGSN